jgi:hypothetical protein
VGKWWPGQKVEFVKPGKNRNASSSRLGSPSSPDRPLSEGKVHLPVPVLERRAPGGKWTEAAVPHLDRVDLELNLLEPTSSTWLDPSLCPLDATDPSLLRGRHRFDLPALLRGPQQTSVVLLAVPSGTAKKLRRSHTTFFLRDIVTAFGKASELSFLLDGEYAACGLVVDNEPGFAGVYAGIFTLALVEGGRVVAATGLRFLPPTNPFLEKPALGRLVTMQPVEEHGYENRDVCFWWALHQAGISPLFGSADKLAAGWVGQYCNRVTRLGRLLRECRDVWKVVDQELAQVAVNREGAREFLQIVREGASDLGTLLRKTISLLGQDGACVGELLAAAQEFEAAAVSATERPVSQWHLLLRWLIDVAVTSPEITKCGSLLPWVEKGTGRLKTIHLQAGALARIADPGDYWRRLRLLPVFNWGNLLTGEEFPADFTEKAQANWAGMPLALKAEETLADGILLLRRASELRQWWTIPPKALVQLAVGSFTHLQVEETREAVTFLARTPAGEFAVFHLEPETGFLDLSAHTMVPAENFPSYRQVFAAVFMLLAAVVHDFWVVEHRETVFARRPLSRRERCVLAADVTVVYLPRVRYHARIDSSGWLATLSSEFDDHPESSGSRRPVAAHPRRLPPNRSPSPEALLLAARYREQGIELAPGETFVRDHTRGARMADEAMKIYRSRSALQCVFQEGGQTDHDGWKGTDWFAFQRRVASFFLGEGFKLLKARPSRSPGSRAGDGGVDVYAVRDLGKPSECRWIAQCKCSGVQEPVGVPVVREFAWARSQYPRGTKGLIVTTSRFTVDATELARREEITLVNFLDDLPNAVR